MDHGLIRRMLSAVMVVGLLATSGGWAHADMSGLRFSNGRLAGPGQCPQSYPAAINRKGDIVGECIVNEARDVSKQISYSVLFRGSRASLIDVPHSKSMSTVVFGINSEGNIVGNYSDQKGNVDYVHGFLLHAGRYTTFDDPSAHEATYASDINDAGDIVGYYLDTKDNFNGFLLRRGRYARLNDPRADPDTGGTEPYAINNQGDVVGFYTDVKWHNHGFLIHRGRYSTLDDPAASRAAYLGTQASGIDDRGDVVGNYDVNRYLDKKHSNNVYHGFLLRGGRYTTIDVPHSLSTSANDINAQGNIVGDYLDAHQVEHGFLLHAGHFTTIDFPKPGRNGSYFRTSSRQHPAGRDWRTAGYRGSGSPGALGPLPGP